MAGSKRCFINIGDTSVNVHLVTIGSAAENDLVFNQQKGTGYSPWIGFYNSGKQGQFAWIIDFL
ncbi:MAG: C-type lectin domain-containing protein [Chitinophagaceae bacterium]